MSSLSFSIVIFSSKLLSQGQKDLFNNTLKVESSDFVKTATNRIKPLFLKAAHKNVVITSKNGVEALLNNCPVEDLNFEFSSKLTFRPLL